MLCAYYDKTCDSTGLFDDLEIAKDAGYRDHLNRYDVIYLDMTGVIGEASIEDLVSYIQRNVVRELTEQYPDLIVTEGFTATLANAAETAGNQFIMIIDEWDAPIREVVGDGAVILTAKEWRMEDILPLWQDSEGWRLCDQGNSGKKQNVFPPFHG